MDAGVGGVADVYRHGHRKRKKVTVVVAFGHSGVLKPSAVTLADDD